MTSRAPVPAPVDADDAVDAVDLLRAPVEVSDVERVEGPLLFVTGTAGVGWDEDVVIRGADGSTRHGVVIDVDEELALVQVFEGTEGLGVGGNVVAFSGTPLRVPVTERWLGRTCDGRGAPLDGGPPVRSAHRRAVAGTSINPAHRDVPRDPVVTGISAIDGLATLVRGQKLPIFSIGGLPHLELAIQVAAQATVEGADFRVVFAGIGVTNADADLVRAGLEERLHRGEAALFVNTADDPTMERILVPRLALTVAEHLAFDLGQHVLVVLTDMTSYCDAVRELAAARGEVPSRRGYPGYLFSDLAGIYERCGRVRGRPGSITELPVLTMPAGDITHPVPDLTGYITEGQVVLSTDLHARGVSPPVDPLSSLSRLMRRGAGPGRTRDDHLSISAQVLALLARARQAEQLASLIGADALSVTERRFLDFAGRFERELLDQSSTEARTLDDTLDRAWRIAATVPRRELTMVSTAEIEAHAPRSLGPAGRAAQEEP
jgi:V/A-type H+/Na+-transporting ATPase subunit B